MTPSRTGGVGGGVCHHREMDLRTAPLTVQVEAFEQMIMSNPIVAAIVRRIPDLNLPDCWLTAGCLFQTVWNVLAGRDAQAGIIDYDINYFDASDQSWEAEDRAIRRSAEAFVDFDATVEVRNEARVHLWYEEKFGTACPPYRSTPHAISTFPNCSSCFGVRPGDGRLDVFAPYGFTDLFSMTTRPNPVLAPAQVYEAKTRRWQEQWPTLTVIPWPT